MKDTSDVHRKVTDHYASGTTDLSTRILDALKAAGKNIDALQPEDLAPIDEFHVRGRAATLELARAAGVTANLRVLDVGSGVGGPSRCIAGEFGCHVVGIDLTDEYCQAATMLAARIGLSDRITYECADALALPFPDDSFDVVWTQHVAMNVADKAMLYREMHRVLRPGGTLAIYDILAGPEQPVWFPVPWARTSATSFLVTPDELRGLLGCAGFRIDSWVDSTAIGRDWFTAIAKRIEAKGLPALSFHVLLGEDFAAMAQNQRRNLEQDRIALAQVVARKGA